MPPVRGTVYVLFLMNSCYYVYVYITQVNQPTLLKKYDEEIEGEKKKSFTLG